MDDEPLEVKVTNLGKVGWGIRIWKKDQDPTQPLRYLADIVVKDRIEIGPAIREEKGREVKHVDLWQTPTEVTKNILSLKPTEDEVMEEASMKGLIKEVKPERVEQGRKQLTNNLIRLAYYQWVMDQGCGFETRIDHITDVEHWREEYRYDYEEVGGWSSG